MSDQETITVSVGQHPEVVNKGIDGMMAAFSRHIARTTLDGKHIVRAEKAKKAYAKRKPA